MIVAGNWRQVLLPRVSRVGIAAPGAPPGQRRMHSFNWARLGIPSSHLPGASYDYDIDVDAPLPLDSKLLALILEELRDYTFLFRFRCLCPRRSEW